MGTFAGSAVGYGLGHVPVVTLLAVVAVAASRVVPTVETHATTPSARKFVKLHVEAAPTSMQVAVAGWEDRRVASEHN